MQTVVVDHPIVQARLTVMRDERSSNAEFRAALRELATLLVYEATRTWRWPTCPITTPVGADRRASRIANPPLLVPVLRAGLGMAEAAFNLLPESQMGFVGLARDERDPRADAYMASLPRRRWPAGRCSCSTRCWRPAARCCTACGCSPTRGADDITVDLRAGRARGHGRGSRRAACRCGCSPPAIDEGLNDNAYIVPGLGDAGDRQFGPR